MGNRSNDFQLDKEYDDLKTDPSRGIAAPTLLDVGKGSCDCRSPMGCLLDPQCRKRDQATSTRSLVVQVKSYQLRKVCTGLAGYSDTLGTRENYHCKQLSF